jgi:hypothetical protein
MLILETSTWKPKESRPSRNLEAGKRIHSRNVYRGAVQSLEQALENSSSPFQSRRAAGDDHSRALDQDFISQVELSFRPETTN